MKETNPGENRRWGKMDFDDNLIAEMIEAFDAIESGKRWNPDALLDEFNGSYEEDLSFVGGDEQRAGTALGRNHLSKFLDIVDSSPEGYEIAGKKALSILQNAIRQRQSALETIFGYGDYKTILPASHNSGKTISEKSVMKEHANLVKNLRRLLETEVSQAEVMMAAKGFAQELQEMVEKIGRLQNEDLPPVTDQMRETYGMESASAFQTQIYGSLQSVMDSLYTAKGQVDDAVANMASTGQVTAQVDMDKDINIDVEKDITVDPMDAEMDADLDNLEGELDAEDEFGAADGEEPLGRAMKTESLQRKVVEMKRLVEKAKKLREARG